jgi:hypothetical protein
MMDHKVDVPVLPGFHGVSSRPSYLVARAYTFRKRVFKLLNKFFSSSSMSSHIMKPQFSPPFTVPPNKMYHTPFQPSCHDDVLSGVSLQSKSNYSNSPERRLLPGKQKMGHSMSSDARDVVLSMNPRAKPLFHACVRS